MAALLSIRASYPSTWWTPCAPVRCFRYRTLMGYSCGSYTPRVNYFSNPDVSTLGRVTGTATEDNARVVRDNMVSRDTTHDALILVLPI